MGKNEGHVTITHNEIYDIPYTAITCGGNHSVISYNKIHDGMKVLRDGSGIYITFCDSLSLTNNFVYDIPKGDGTSSYYLDEKTNNSTVKENLSIGVTRAIHTHLSKNNTYDNNVFIVEQGDVVLSFQKSEGIVFKNNIVLSDNSVFVVHPEGLKLSSNNIAFCPGNGNPSYDLFMHKYGVLAEVSTLEGFKNIDPEILAYSEGTVKLSDSSLALKSGIKPVDVASAGIIE